MINKQTIFECVKSNKETINDLTKQTSYYLSYYEDLCRDKIVAKWNTSAFLFSAYWLLYRKMYLDFVTYLAFIYVSATLYTHVIRKALIFLLGINIANDISPFVLLVIRFIPAIFYGFYGNYLYFLNIEERLKKNKSQGTNLIAPIILIMFLLFIFEKKLVNPS